MNRNKNRRWLLPALAALLSAPLQAEVTLPRLISDGMVLQRDTELKIWGRADPGESVSVQFDRETYRTEADDGGNWQLTLPEQPAGGPHSMRIEGDNSIAIDDILIGDVWLASGQSNMEYPLRRILPPYGPSIDLHYTDRIRQFAVPQRYDFKTPQADLDGGRWQRASEQNLPAFSAVGYFFAERLHAQRGVPIGVINASLGGSPAEAWLSEEALKKFPQHYKELQRFKDDALIEHIQREDKARSDRWHNRVDSRDAGLDGGEPAWAAAELDTSDWKTLEVPGYWADTEGEIVNGAVWLRKTFTLPEHLDGQDAMLALGRIVDADTTYINGEKVGNTTYLYPRRRYPVPAELLDTGENTIAIRVINQRGRGGFVADKPYRLRFGHKYIDLRGDWQYRIGTTAEPAPDQTFVRWKPTGLYNGMIHPLLDYPIRGAIWYQGESNVGRAEEYRQLFPTLIRDWRSRWQRDFPFLFVQLTNFLEARNAPGDSDWARLREAQASALALPDTAMAVAIDVGEWNDIHALDKKTVGDRLALAAQQRVYGEDIVGSGPRFESMKIDGDRALLRFSGIGDGLAARGGPLREFALAGEDRQFHWAEAEIVGDRVILHSDAVDDPVAVRYAWADNPENANLYNSAGLPAAPFRTDDWPRDAEH
ncbi:sialate O-acetylesterase [Microbulbifer halophilus]|uniref:Sialate O-acetylesterase n=1 Tax=Microbulbifer halophilus TaxID=453963 RepID=A0ABW5EBP4_9GAMM|nr:sialate O-acetylesterase [Microbulbifer halophilus]MCW8125871.1 9-O-acetylesterase [Microbulbifer halophilus]